MQSPKRSVATLAVLVASLSLAACDSSSGATAGAAGTVGPDPMTVPIEFLDIAIVDPMICTGTPLQFEAWGTLSDGEVIDVTRRVTWESSNTVVATISSAGLATSLDVLGVTIITATDPVGGLIDTTTLTVTEVAGALSYISLNRGSVIGGSDTPVTGTVALTCGVDAPVTIELWATGWVKGKHTYPFNGEVQLPPSVTVGADPLEFGVTHSAVTARTRVWVNASDGTYPKKASLWLRAGR
jgi:hypothetical protein